jgi:hypothetical protein
MPQVLSGQWPVYFQSWCRDCNCLIPVLATSPAEILIPLEQDDTALGSMQNDFNEKHFGHRTEIVTVRPDMTVKEAIEAIAAHPEIDLALIVVNGIARLRVLEGCRELAAPCDFYNVALHEAAGVIARLAKEEQCPGAG